MALHLGPVGGQGVGGICIVGGEIRVDRAKFAVDLYIFSFRNGLMGPIN